MTIDFIAYGIFIYFLGLIFAGGLAIIGGQWRKSAQLFVLTNLVGFIFGMLYLFNFSTKSILLGSWSWLFNFAPSINLLSGIFFTLIAGVSCLVGVYATRYLELYEESYNPSVVQFLTAFFVLGMQGVLFSNNAFGFLFFWEVMSIASFFLVMIDKSPESIRAAFLYFIMTHLGASAILGGFLILGWGSIFSDFSGIAVASSNLSPMLSGLVFVLFLFGFGSKAGLVPFHVWLPEAHPQAPSNISALMSGLMLKVAVFGFIKIVFSLTNLPAWAGLVVIILGLLSAVVGVLYAVIERDVKRAFAYSSIENMGIIFTILGIAIYILSQSRADSVVLISNAFVVFAIFHAINHALFKTGLFLSSGVLINRFHSKRIEVMGGLANIMPIFSFAFLLVILSSLPLPPFGTFYGEWGLVQNVINVLHNSLLDSTTMIVLVLSIATIGLVSGLAVFAMIKIFGISMLGLSKSKHVERRAEKTDYMLSAPIMTLGLGVIVLGIFAKTIIKWLSVRSELFATAPSVSSSLVNSNLSSVLVFLLPAVFLLGVYALYKFVVKKDDQRIYKTWDCGQAIDATMQYSGTAFSGPIRFFFLQLLGRDKVLSSIPVVETNPWVRKYVLTLSFSSIWKDKIYEPIAGILNFVAERMKMIQGGRIQYYLLFVLGTLIVTLLVVL
ncbi:MAG: proton-conducting transporter membrane subunit [bacterium]